MPYTITTEKYIELPETKRKIILSKEEVNGNTDLPNIDKKEVMPEREDVIKVEKSGNFASFEPSIDIKVPEKTPSDLLMAFLIGLGLFIIIAI